MTNASERALAAANLMTQQSEPLSLTPLSSAHARVILCQSSVRPRQLLPPSLAAAAARAVADPPLSAALSPFAAAPIACCRHLCRARTRMYEIVRRQGVTHTQISVMPSNALAAAAPAAIAALTGPCQTQNAKTPELVRGGPRALDARP